MSTQLAARALFAGLLDDAAMFPPGNAAAKQAVDAHRRHRSGWYADLVGPLLVHADRWQELLAAVDRGPSAPASVDRGPSALAVVVIGSLRRPEPVPRGDQGRRLRGGSGPRDAGAPRRRAALRGGDRRVARGGRPAGVRADLGRPSRPSGPAALT